MSEQYLPVYRTRAPCVCVEYQLYDRSRSGRSHRIAPSDRAPQFVPQPRPAGPDRCLPSTPPRSAITVSFVQARAHGRSNNYPALPAHTRAWLVLPQCCNFPAERKTSVLAFSATRRSSSEHILLYATAHAPQPRVCRTGCETSGWVGRGAHTCLSPVGGSDADTRAS